MRSNPQAILQDDAEDIHSWVESKLIDKVGNLGKKLHTGRSRNDQVALRYQNVVQTACNRVTRVCS